jgi:hypothetical protein
MATQNSPNNNGTPNQNPSELFDPFPEPKTWPTKWDGAALHLHANLRPVRSKDGKRPQS